MTAHETSAHPQTQTQEDQVKLADQLRTLADYGPVQLITRAEGYTAHADAGR